MRDHGENRSSLEKKRKSPPSWLRRYRWGLLMISLAVPLIFGVFMVQPLYFAITHFNALDCGGPVHFEVVRSYPGGDPKAIKAATCFLQAHQQCRAANMEISSVGSGGVYQETFYTANDLGSCSLSIEIRSGRLYVTTIRHLSCASLLRKTDGLHFLNCGDGGDEVFPYYSF